MGEEKSVETNGRLVAVVCACKSSQIVMISFSARGLGSGSLKQSCPRWLVTTSTVADLLRKSHIVFIILRFNSDSEEKMIVYQSRSHSMVYR